MVRQYHLHFDTPGRGTQNISSQVQQQLSAACLEIQDNRPNQPVNGLVNLFIQHTSASLILCENADPTVRQDLERFMQRLIPDGDPMLKHVDEGPDDMPAHIRTLLTESSLTIPFNAGQLQLGTWQGIFLWEHRHWAHRRKIIMTLYAG